MKSLLHTRALLTSRINTSRINKAHVTHQQGVVYLQHVQCNHMSLREPLAASLPLALNTLTTLTIMATLMMVRAMPAHE